MNITGAKLWLKFTFAKIVIIIYTNTCKVGHITNNYCDISLYFGINSFKEINS